MSITSDIRSYADTAVSQGKQVLSQAQAQLNDVSGTVTSSANEFVGKYRENVTDIADKATEAVSDLRASAEKAVNLEAIKSAVEPYLAQVKGYTHKLTDSAEELLAAVKSDPRLSKVLEQAGIVVETVQLRVVKPVADLTGFGAKPAAKPAATTSPAAKAAPKPATKPAATKPATKRPATKTTTRKAPAKRATKA